MILQKLSLPNHLAPLLRSAFSGLFTSVTSASSKAVCHWPSLHGSVAVVAHSRPRGRFRLWKLADNKAAPDSSAAG